MDKIYVRLMLSFLWLFTAGCGFISPLPPCEGDQDCQVAQSCEDGRCVSGTPESTNRLCDPPCPEGMICIDGGSCSDAPCGQGSDCPDGFECTDAGLCDPFPIQFCDADAGCPDDGLHRSVMTACPDAGPCRSVGMGCRAPTLGVEPKDFQPLRM